MPTYWLNKNQLAYNSIHLAGNYYQLAVTNLFHLKALWKQKQIIPGAFNNEMKSFEWKLADTKYYHNKDITRAVIGWISVLYKSIKTLD